jgi:signal transduction histidine kinase
MSEPPALRAIGRELVASRAEIIEDWRRRIAELPELRRLPDSAIVDHMPEFLYELARAIVGDPDATQQVYERIISGHALQRLGFGVSLATLLEEYAALRQVILAHLLRAAPVESLREELLELDRTLELAIGGSIRAFAAQRDEQREHFISVLGHDLRGPLQALSMGAENILRRPDCGEPLHARAAAAMRRSAERMGRLISDVIDFARGKLGGGIPSVPQTCDMGEVCREVVDELLVAHPDRQLSLLLDGDLVGSWDRDRVVQAIANLVANALAHGADPITVRAFVAPDRQTVTTEVHNHGPAIPPEMIPHLFDAYRRGKTSAPGGLGLGLYIVQQIALAHGGECFVRSTEEEGTTFSIQWPRAPLGEVPRPYQLVV